MTKTTVAYSKLVKSRDAGCDLGRQICDALGPSPTAVVLFASSQFDYAALLNGIQETCHPEAMVGSSSAGEFTTRNRGEGTACALALRSDDIKVAVGVSEQVSSDRVAAARTVVGSFTGFADERFPYKSALVLTDALAGHADEVVEQLTLATSGGYQFAGGGAGDDAKFSCTHVFAGTRAYTDAVVALELVSRKPIGIGVGHGWTPAGGDLRVTEAEGSRVIGLNGIPAADVFAEHASRTGQAFDRAAPLPFFLHNILGIDTGSGHRLRVPLAVNGDGSVTCAAEIPEGSRVRIMKATTESAVVAARNATTAAMAALDGEQAAGALFFDCVATRLRLGERFAFEVDAVSDLLGAANLAGCNTYGQIARAAGQFGGFHNCTAVVMVLPA